MNYSNHSNHLVSTLNSTYNECYAEQTLGVGSPSSPPALSSFELDTLDTDDDLEDSGDKRGESCQKQGQKQLIY